MPRHYAHRSVSLRVALALHATVIAVPPGVAAAAPLNCAPTAAAGKPAPPAVAGGPKDAFQIFWQLATQMEDLADAPEGSDRRKAIADVQKHVNGYYIAVLPNQLGYWPHRPAECAKNFGRYGDRAGIEAAQELRKKCNRSFAATIGGDGSNDRAVARDAYREALDKVLRNLDIKGEQARGKMVIGQMLLTNADFKYDAAKGELTLQRLPSSYCYLNAAGLSVNNVMAYQEPRPQTRNGTLLQVPRPGSRKTVGEDRRAMLPFNLDFVEQLNRSFHEASIPLSQFSINVRRWNERMSTAMAAKPRDEHIGGVFFEGGTEIISTKRRPVPRIDNFAEGIAWLLSNSDENIFLLMPGFWEKTELKSAEDRDELIPRLRKTITLLNEKIEQRLGTKPARPAICTNRLHFILASYGSPSHVKPLPPERNGKPAGTVSGEIMLLAQMRKEMCGTNG